MLKHNNINHNHVIDNLTELRFCLLTRTPRGNVLQSHLGQIKLDMLSDGANMLELIQSAEEIGNIQQVFVAFIFHSARTACGDL